MMPMVENLLPGNFDDFTGETIKSEIQRKSLYYKKQRLGVTALLHRLVS